jgi:hypothetical protein
MNKNLILIIGYNYNNLLGSENDAILIYNIFYRFYLQNKKKFIKPKIFLNENVKINLIKDYIKKKKFVKLIIYFSGHSSKNNIFFYKKRISREFFLNEINKNLNLKVDLFLILDSCYSEKFCFITNKFNNINKQYFILATKENEKSSEGFVNFNEKFFKYKKIKKLNDNNYKIVLGIFTYNLCKLLYNKQINEIKDIFIIIKSPIWYQIKKICNQEMKIKILE